MIHSGVRSSEGFSYLELLAAVSVTFIVLGAVFGLLARGTETNTVEIERADLQGQARHALDTLSRDVILAGTDLPPEIPSFFASGPTIREQGDRVEILGNFRGDAGGSGPLLVESFDGYTARLAEPSPYVGPGDVVVLFDDKPTRGSWLFGLVREIRNGSKPEVDILTGAGSTVVGLTGEVTLPADVERYNRTPDGLPQSGFLSRISVISYEIAGRATLANGGDGANVLVKRINWGEPSQVAAIESMEIRYFVGGTVTGPGYEYFRRGGGSRGRGPRIQRDGPPSDGPPGNRRSAPPSRDGGPPGNPREETVTQGDEVEVPTPPLPQPDPNQELVDGNLIRGVRISVTSRSRRGNLMGSELLDDDPADAMAHVRQTLTTRVTPRNLLNQANRRRMTMEATAEAPVARSPR